MDWAAKRERGHGDYCSCDGYSVHGAHSENPSMGTNAARRTTSGSVERE